MSSAIDPIHGLILVLVINLRDTENADALPTDRHHRATVALENIMRN